MNTKTKLTRLVLAASLGSVIWAGCSTTDSRYTSTIAPREMDSAAIASAPVDQTKRRPDTHPELRNGLWQFTYRNDHAMVETTTVPATQPGEAADSTALLAYNPEVINAASQSDFGSSSSIAEAAGAETKSDLHGTKRVK